MIHLTESAALQIIEMMKQTERPEAQYLRIKVQGGGCTGLSYGMGFDEAKTEKDVSFPQHGVDVIVAEADHGVVDGLEIDYKQSMLGGGFTIKNPNAIATCGCGSSFRTATNAGTPGEC